MTKTNCDGCDSVACYGSCVGCVTTSNIATDASRQQQQLNELAEQIKNNNQNIDNDFEAGRCFGLEEAARLIERNLTTSGRSLQTRITPWVDYVDCIRSCVSQIRRHLSQRVYKNS